MRWVCSGLVTKQKPAAWLTGLASAMACFRSGLVSAMHLQLRSGAACFSSGLVSAMHLQLRSGAACFSSGLVSAMHLQPGVPYDSTKQDLKYLNL
jgi:hypothetical protein